MHYTDYTIHALLFIFSILLEIVVDLLLVEGSVSTSFSILLHGVWDQKLCAEDHVFMCINHASTVGTRSKTGTGLVM